MTEPDMRVFPVYENPRDSIEVDHGGVLKLHVVGPGQGSLATQVSTFSPFAVKLEAYLRMFDIPYELVIEPIPDVGPRGKAPFVSVGDDRFADSQLVIEALRPTHGDPDADLRPDQQAIGHLVQRTLEDHLYWIIVYYEFYDQNGWDFLLGATAGDPSLLPVEVRAALAARREDFCRRCHDQGIARYTPHEIVAKANRDLAAISQILGGHRYLLGTDRPTSFDAVLLGFTTAIFQVRGMHPEITDFARGIPNLGRYVQHMLATYYPELELAFQPA
ncbi:putative glutathione S-transferase [Macrophomina phaseolina]|uniref:Glutathione S-transferase n=1 Tax=Macrophomina phaseolina TaxID=35725 RepID=A0ABQ8FS78_9PEZI|nr:putative glutathione S-transferase [Macrophomina phaseolina]